jgi:uncharacterized protein (UPF0210 family)
MKLAETYQVLDVGSCHDPLLKNCLNKNINVTPIDLCPSSKSHLKTDLDEGHKSIGVTLIFLFKQFFSNGS